MEIHLKRFTKSALVATILAAPLLMASPAQATNDEEHGNGNPCPVSERIPVYAQNGNPNHHFICSNVKGEKGDDGEKGDTGATGPKGDAGATGPAGPAGPAGEGVGIPGLKGDKGDTGATGPAGTNGADGADGDDGAVGAPGANAFIEYNAILSDLLDVNGDCGENGGSVYNIGTVGDENDDILIVCNGKDGKASVVPGPAGEDGKDGLTTTRIVREDGTVEYSPLPDTGGNGEPATTNYWAMGGAAAALLAAGTGVVLYTRRRTEV